MAIKSGLSHASDSAPDAMSRYLFVVDRTKALRYCKRSTKDINEILDLTELSYRYLDGLETKETYRQKVQDFLDNDKKETYRQKVQDFIDNDDKVQRELRSKENA